MRELLGGNETSEVINWVNNGYSWPFILQDR